MSKMFVARLFLAAIAVCVILLAVPGVNGQTVYTPAQLTEFADNMGQWSLGVNSNTTTLQQAYAELETAAKAAGYSSVKEFIASASEANKWVAALKAAGYSSPEEFITAVKNAANSQTTTSGSLTIQAGENMATEDLAEIIRAGGADNTTVVIGKNLGDGSKVSAGGNPYQTSVSAGDRVANPSTTTVSSESDPKKVSPEQFQGCRGRVQYISSFRIGGVDYSPGWYWWG